MDLLYIAKCYQLNTNFSNSNSNVFCNFQSQSKAFRDQEETVVGVNSNFYDIVLQLAVKLAHL